MEAIILEMMKQQEMLSKSEVMLQVVNEALGGKHRLTSVVLQNELGSLMQAPPQWSSGYGTWLQTHRSWNGIPAAAAAFSMGAEML